MDLVDPADTTLPELVGRACDIWGDGLAVVDGPVRMSYSDLGEGVERTARALAASGARPGDRVAVWAPNCWQWVVAALAVMRAGAVLVPVNSRFKGEEAADVMRRSRARYLFAVTDFLGVDHVAVLDDHDLPDLAEIVVLFGPTPSPTPTPTPTPTNPASTWPDSAASMPGSPGVTSLASFDERASAVEGIEIERARLPSAPTTSGRSCSPRAPRACPRG